MVFTRKFSEFPHGGNIQAGDEPVGLEAGVNTIWDYPFVVTAAHAGMRASIPIWTGTDFVLTDSDLQIVGSNIVPTAGDTEDAAGFGDQWGAFHWPAHGTAGRPGTPADGDVYYDTDLNQFFGFVNGNWVPFGSGQGALIVKTIIQNNTFVPGDWLRTDGGPDAYVLADGTTLANAQAVGVVIDATPTQFTIQVDGFIPTGIFVGLTVGGIYYLDPANPGKMMLGPPIIVSQGSKPVFSADSATTGWILPQRPLAVGDNGGGGGTTQVVDQPGNTFVAGDWLKLDNTSPQALYIKALADNGDDADVIGVVDEIIIAGQTFVLRQSGFTTTAFAATVLVPGGNYFLHPSNLGQMTLTEPNTNGQVSRPVFTAYNLTSGWVLPYRGYVIGGGAIVNPGTNIDTQEITQIGHGFVVGEWLRTDGAVPGQPYAKAQGDTLANAQAVGVVIKVIDANHFVLQENGYLGPDVLNIDYTLNPGEIWYLDPNNAGKMVNVEPNAPGQIAKPLFAADGDKTGWVLPQRPLPVDTGAGGGPIITTITTIDPHGFLPGDWVRTQNNVNLPYTKAQADTLANSWVVGLVIEAIDAFNFRLQQAGYVTGVFSLITNPTTPLTKGQIYYLSETTAGVMQTTVPTALNQATRPLFTADGDNSGWIFPNRPDEILPSDNTAILVVTQPGNPFALGDLVAVDTTTGQYVKAIANNMSNAYKTIGFVIGKSGDDITIQQSGYSELLAPVIPTDAATILPGRTYFLSPITAGRVQLAEPIGLTTVSRPVLDATDTDKGWILPQRPILNASGIVPPGGGTYQLITTVNVTPGATNVIIDLPGIFDGTFTDVRIVGRNFQFTLDAAGAFQLVGRNMVIYYYINGILTTDNNYYFNNIDTESAQPAAFYNGVLIQPGSAFPDYYSYNNQQLSFTLDLFSIPNSSTVKTGVLEVHNQKRIGPFGPHANTFWTRVTTEYYGNPSGSNTGPITGIQLFLPILYAGGPASQSVTNGQLSIYGIMA